MEKILKPGSINARFSLLSLLMIIFSTFNLTSCSPVPYGNVGQNVPLLKNKGEVHFTGNIANTDDANGVGIQAAVAVDSSWALMASFYNVKNNPNTDWNGNGRYVELGVGKYAVIGKSKWVYDVFAGIGFGGIKNDNGIGSSLNLNFAKPFVQGSIGFTTEWIELAFTPRLALPFYTSHENNLTDLEHRAQAELYFKENKTKFVFEPGITFRFGYKGIKANLNMCVSSFSLNEQYSDVSINNLYFGAGIAALISKRYN